jgi:tetratricopeptide (TPR) repeat protein
MMTTKKWRRFHCNFAVAVAAGTLLTACGPPGARQLQEGQQYIQSGQFADAIVVLLDATRILSDAPHPVQAKAWNLLGVACQGGGQLDAANKAYLAALKLDRNNAAVDYNLGCLRSQQANFRGAIDYLNTYVMLRPKDIQGHLRLGTAYFHYALEQSGPDRSRSMEIARHDFENAERLGATADAANALGVLDLLQHRTPNAAAISAAATSFGLALRRDPHCAPALLNLAIVSQQYLNNPRQAFKLYSDYLTISPPPPRMDEVSNLVNDLNLRLRTTIITPQAAPVPAPSPRLAPPQARVMGAPSNPVASMPKPPPLASPRAKVIVPPTPAPAPAPAPMPTPQSPPRISPAPPASQAPPAASPTVNTSNPVSEPVVAETTTPPQKTTTQRLNPRRWFEEKSKNFETASASGAVEPPPVTAGTRYEYPPPVTPIPGDRAQAERLEAEAIRAQQSGDLTQSIRAYKDAIAADPTFYDTSYGLGLAEIEARDYAAALEALHRALALRDDSTQARYAFAWTLQRRGYTEDAVHELNELLGQRPADVRAHLLLGNLYAEKLGQPKLAREQYAQALALDPNNAQAANVRVWLQHNP